MNEATMGEQPVPVHDLQGRISFLERRLSEVTAAAEENATAIQTSLERAEGVIQALRSRNEEMRAEVMQGRADRRALMTLEACFQALLKRAQAAEARGSELESAVAAESALTEARAELERARGMLAAAIDIVEHGWHGASVAFRAAWLDRARAALAATAPAANNATPEEVMTTARSTVSVSATLGDPEQLAGPPVSSAPAVAETKAGCTPGCKGIEIAPGEWSGCACPDGRLANGEPTPPGFECDCPQHPGSPPPPAPGAPAETIWSRARWALAKACMEANREGFTVAERHHQAIMAAIDYGEEYLREACAKLAELRLAAASAAPGAPGKGLRAEAERLVRFWSHVADLFEEEKRTTGDEHILIRARATALQLRTCATALRLALSAPPAAPRCECDVATKVGGGCPVHDSPQSAGKESDRE